MDLAVLLREFGLPVLFCLWLMFRVERELRELRQLVHKQVVISAVISRTLDLPDGVTSSVLEGARRRDGEP